MKFKTNVLKLFLGLLALGLCSCAYMQSTARQTAFNFYDDFRRDDRPDNRLIKEDTFFVFGKLGDDLGPRVGAQAVVALARFKNTWILVDRKNLAPQSKTFVLNLPRGDYQIVVVDDQGRGGSYLNRDIVGVSDLSLPKEAEGTRVVGHFEIGAGSTIAFEKFDRLRIPVGFGADPRANAVSIPNHVDNLDASIFSEANSKIGLYNPPRFLDLAPSLLYSLGDDDETKTPVIFVHGINGSAREFVNLANTFDRSKYSLWFFHYPSGYDLDLLADVFYELVLSGHYIATKDRAFVIIAHSMGGLVTREALNRLDGTKGQARVGNFVTIASPLGGMAFARPAGSAPLVLPAWRDLSPESDFISNLHRKPLPEGLRYNLFYTSGKINAQTTKGEPGDGVVPLSSQLSSESVGESNLLTGIDESHTGVLSNQFALELIVASVGENDHLAMNGFYSSPNLRLR